MIELNKVLSKLETLNSKKKIPEKHGLEVPKSSLSSGRPKKEKKLKPTEETKKKVKFFNLFFIFF